MRLPIFSSLFLSLAFLITDSQCQEKCGPYICTNEICVPRVVSSSTVKSITTTITSIVVTTSYFPVGTVYTCRPSIHVPRGGMKFTWCGFCEMFFVVRVRYLDILV